MVECRWEIKAEHLFVGEACVRKPARLALGEPGPARELYGTLLRNKRPVGGWLRCSQSNRTLDQGQGPQSASLSSSEENGSSPSLSSASESGSGSAGGKGTTYSAPSKPMEPQIWKLPSGARTARRCVSVLPSASWFATIEVAWAVRVGFKSAEKHRCAA